jgi:hypothetical protein
MEKASEQLKDMFHPTSDTASPHPELKISLRMQRCEKINKELKEVLNYPIFSIY